MAANLTPQYLEAEARYRAAKTPEEQLAALEEMWRELPKHKSSEKIQAELKKKLSAARKALQQAGRRGPTHDPFCIARGGAGQVVLLGPPNVGKSSLVGGLTHAHVKIAEYPFSTALPVPGMVPFEDIQIQLIDTPPVTPAHVPPGSAGLWHTADALLVVCDLGSDECVTEVETCLGVLAERRIALHDGPRGRAADGVLHVPGLVLASQQDRPGAEANLGLLREFFPPPLRIEPVSAHDPAALARLPRLLFELLRIIRIYAKPPGRKPDLDEPFVLPAGSNVHDLARRIYRGLEQRVHAARLWSAGHAVGLNVQLDHELHDRDVVELHV